MVRLPKSKNSRRRRRREPQWLKKAPPVIHVSTRVNARPWDPGFVRGNPCMVRPFIRGRGIN